MAELIPESPEKGSEMSEAPTHQLTLDGQDSNPSCLTVALLARDDDHLRVAVLSGQVDLGVGLLADLQEGSFCFVLENTFVLVLVSLYWQLPF